MPETLRQRAELYLSTEVMSNVEWKVLVREMLERGVFEDDPLKLPAFVREVIEREVSQGKIPKASEVAAQAILRSEVTEPIAAAVREAMKSGEPEK